MRIGGCVGISVFVKTSGQNVGNKDMVNIYYSLSEWQCDYQNCSIAVIGTGICQREIYDKKLYKMKV